MNYIHLLPSGHDVWVHYLS